MVAVCGLKDIDVNVLFLSWALICFLLAQAVVTVSLLSCVDDCKLVLLPVLTFFLILIKDFLQNSSDMV